MERLFSPCIRDLDLVEREHILWEFRGILEEFERRPRRMQELNLNVSTDEFLRAERGFTYADLCTMLENGNTLAWLTPHAFIGRGGAVLNSLYQLDESYRFHFDAEDIRIHAWARSSEHLSEICDVVLRLLAASVVHSVILSKWTCFPNASINAASLAYLMEQCQSLKVFTLQDLEIDEDQIRVLGDFSRPGLEIELKQCGISGAAATVLAHVLGRNQGPTTLDSCRIDNTVLANGLRGNSRLKSFMQGFSVFRDFSNTHVLAIANAVRENQGLVELCLFYGFHANDETWGAVCDCLRTHPTLEVVYLVPTCVSTSVGPPPMAPDVITSRMQGLLDMIKVNTSIHTIHLHSGYSEHELFRRSVLPHLETNRLRSRVRAIQKSRPNAYRAKVLGRALLATRTNPNRMWMLLSGNPDLALPFMTAATTVSPNLPTPTTAAATSNLATVAATYCYRDSNHFYKWCLSCCCCSRVTTSAVTDTRY
jgi:hypothetical protein